jgi:hypothetical protein
VIRWQAGCIQSVLLSGFLHVTAVKRRTICLVNAYVWLLQVWLDDCRAAFSALTSDKQTREAAEAAAESAKSYAQPDDLIDFGHLVSNRKGGLSQLELEDQVRPGDGDVTIKC